MLVFCEECGCKNLLADEESNRQPVKFRCGECDYENIWQQPQPKTDRTGEISVAAPSPEVLEKQGEIE